MNEPVLPPFYNPDNHHIPAVRITDEEYAAAISALVVVNSDVVLVDRESKKIGLVMRTRKPAEGLWVIGGRRRAGEPAVTAAQRSFHRETSLEFPLERFAFLTLSEVIWSYRAEAPHDHGRHDLHYVFVVEPSTEEAKLISRNLDPDEYDVEKGVAWLGKTELKNQGARQILIDYWSAIFE